MPGCGEPDTVPWGTGYRTVGNRIPYRGEPDTVPWGTAIFFFLFKIKYLSRIFAP